VSPEQLALAKNLSAAVGWLELGLPKDALAELDRLPEEARGLPDVLEVRWLILADLKQWDTALQTSERLITAAPERASSWLHHAYTVRRASTGGLEAAFHVLASVSDKFVEPTIPYNLACYTCQLQRGEAETMKWFERALALGNPAELIEMAMHDPDLEPVRDLIKPLGTKHRPR
jgi:hypothetical protein